VLAESSERLELLRVELEVGRHELALQLLHDGGTAEDDKRQLLVCTEGSSRPAVVPPPCSAFDSGDADRFVPSFAPGGRRKRHHMVVSSHGMACSH
jgi:hypothetical protein